MTKVRVGWDFFGGKEFQPLSLPEGYGQTRLLDGVGDESSYISNEDLERRVQARRTKNGFEPTEKPSSIIIEIDGMSNQQFMKAIEPLRTRMITPPPRSQSPPRR